MLARVPIKIPLRMVQDPHHVLRTFPRSGRGFQKGEAFLVGIGLSISSFSLKQLSTEPTKSHDIL